MGISETAIHFVIYEHIKSLLTERESGLPDERKKLDFVKFMGAAAMSKTIAATVAYPHGKFVFFLLNCSLRDGHFEVRAILN